MGLTRVHPDEPRRDDAFLRDDVRVCPLADNTRSRACWWVLNGRPGLGEQCVCGPPLELLGKGS